MELAVERNRRLVGMRLVFHAAQHVVERCDVVRRGQARGFRGDRAFDELARPQQLERTFVRGLGWIGRRGGSVT